MTIDIANTSWPTFTATGAGGSFNSWQAGDNVFPLNISLSTAGRVGFYVDYSELATAGTHTFYIARTHGTAGAVSVSYASAGDSHTSISGTLNWLDGDASIQAVSVPVTAGDLSTHDAAGLGEHRIAMDLSSATGGARLLNNARTRAYGVIDNNTMIASDANAVFYDSAGGAGSGTQASPYNNFYTAMAAMGSKRYFYGKGTTLVDTTYQTSIGGNNGAYGLTVPPNRTSEATRAYVRNWPASSWVVDGVGSTQRCGFYTEGGESYHTYKGIDLQNLDNTSGAGGPGSAIFYRYGGSTDINTELCSGTNINGGSNNGFFMPWGVNGAKCWRCDVDGVKKNGDATNENTAAVDVYTASNLSVQRLTAKNAFMGAKQKSPGTSGEGGMCVRFCNFTIADGIRVGVGFGGATNGANGFEDSIVQSNIFSGLNNGIYDNIDASIEAQSIGQHWSNNVFYQCASGENGAIDIKHMKDVISYNNIHHTSRVTFLDRSTTSGDFRYLDHNQDYNHTWAFMYYNNVSKTLAEMQAETIYCDDTAVDDPSFVDTIYFVPQADSSLTGGVDGSERGWSLTGIEVLGA